ncbi:hypothetical protein [Caulobacter segnis]|uniref:DUF4089 domain-containing protein n=1 Tax=Caulobacter segnis TaxID=88688 RepID=A0A2W5XBT9_9CAUL|nr:hypothetical protein [Caulobacter segnis]PZR34761.1 MAG: hypothetical protein DI526_09340 [Caulobacter segnis]
MALDAETQAFLDLTQAEIAPWTGTRAADRDLAIPAAALAGVIDNLALLQAQTRLFVSALGDAAGQAPEPFQP